MAPRSAYMSFDQFVVLVQQYATYHPRLRAGQVFMNVLHSVRPHLYTQLVDADLDVFYTYDATLLDRAKAFVQTHWTQLAATEDDEALDDLFSDSLGG